MVFEFLRDLHTRPEPHAAYTARDLWTDPHVAGQMLAYHLNDEVDAASRRRSFIDRSVAWILTHFDLGPGARVADLGCGPGLYAERLAAAGLEVTGVDFSESSLRYARETAAARGLDIDYVEADYLDLETGAPFDLVLLIMCDFCVLSPERRRRLARRFRSMLAPGGRVLLDVYSDAMFDPREESSSHAPRLMDGFWSPDEYYGFRHTWKYDAERLVLDRYVIVEETRTRTIYNWMQCFSPDALEAELAESGLRVEERFGDVAGGPHDPRATELGVVAGRAEDAGGPG